MRTLIPLLLLLTSFVASAQSGFPPPVTPEIPLTDPILAPGPVGPVVTAATNGDITLAIWPDTRTGFTRLRGTRISPAGEVLDPMGILLDEIYLSALFWNGFEFVAIGARGSSEAQLIFITRDGIIRARKPFLFQGQVLAVRGGERARVLLAHRSSSSGSISYSVLDGNGNVIAQNVALPAVEGTDYVHRIIGGAGDLGFLVLRLKTRPPGPYRVIADRIDENGRLLSSVVSGLDTFVDHPDAIAGNADGWVLVRQPSYSGSSARFTFYLLDVRGVATGKTATMGAPHQAEVARVTADGNRYLVTWSGELTATSGLSFITELRPDGTLSNNYLVGRDVAMPATALLLQTNSGKLAIFGSRRQSGSIYAAKVSETLEVAPATPLTFHAPTESPVRVTASRYGYLTVWQGAGSYDPRETYLRRISTSGKPVGDIIPLGRSYGIPIALTSNGETYLVAWTTTAGTMLRRMRALDGEWIDPAPENAGHLSYLALASNGIDALASWSGPCEFMQCGFTRRIAMIGPMLASQPVAITPPEYGIQPSIASDGMDYLVVWAEGFSSFAPIGPPPPYVLKMARVRADGTRIDSVVSELVPRKGDRYPGNASAVWDGSQYLVTWADRASVRAGRVSREGSVSEMGADGRGTILETRQTSPQPSVIRSGDRVVLTTSWRRTSSSTAPAEFICTGVAFPPATSLAAVAMIPRQTLLDGSDTTYSSLATAAMGQTLLTVYSRLSAADGGGARAYIRLFGDPSPRRRAAAR